MLQCGLLLSNFSFAILLLKKLTRNFFFNFLQRHYEALAHNDQKSLYNLLYSLAERKLLTYPNMFASGTIPLTTWLIPLFAPYPKLVLFLNSNHQYIAHILFGVTTSTFIMAQVNCVSFWHSFSKGSSSSDFKSHNT